MKIILASSSPYRKALLAKVITDFESASPSIDESQHRGESFVALAERLAIEKAQALAAQFPNALIIGSDQVACLETSSQPVQLHKPETQANTVQQLMNCQGKTVHFYTSICLLNSRTGLFQSSVEYYETKFRHLTKKQIENYVRREPALDCAGGFKMEGLGIALFESIEGNDPNILIGLPLIKLISMLENEKVFLL